MRFPDFIIIGAEKSGTTWLKHILNQHNLICVPPQKELHFFDKIDNWNKGLDWYLNQFRICEAKNASCIGEITPAYLHAIDAPGRIKSVCRDVKLIVILRNPVDRVYSNYWMNLSDGFITDKFENYVEKMTDSMFVKGKYKGHLERYFQYFDKNQILILLYDDIANNPGRMMDEITLFLGVEKFSFQNTQKKIGDSRVPKFKFVNNFIVTTASILRKIGLKEFVRANSKKIRNYIIKYNSKKDSYPPMSLDVRKELLAHYKEDMDYLRDELGMNVSSWYA